ncbi:MAG: DUF2924 domain-containing protein [Planctomycetota bacterium]
MSTGELVERYAALTGQPVRTRHRTYLIRKIAWRLQAKAEGDLSERARKRAAELADDADVRRIRADQAPHDRQWGAAAPSPASLLPSSSTDRAERPAAGIDARRLHSQTAGGEPADRTGPHRQRDHRDPRGARWAAIRPGV